MKPLVRNIVRTGDLLDHSIVEDTYNQMRRDARDIVNRRYMRTPCIVDFGPFTSAEVTTYSGLATMIFKPPFATMIRGVEVAANFTTSGSNVMTISATGIDGWKDIEVTSAGMDTDATVILSRDMRIDAAQEVVITATFDNATYTVERLEVTLWLDADRLQGGTDRPLRGSNQMTNAGLRTNEPDSSTYTAMDDDFDVNFNASTGAEKDSANRRLTRITFHRRSDNANTVTSTIDNEDKIPGGDGGEIYSWDHYATGNPANVSDVGCFTNVNHLVIDDELNYAAATAKNQGNVVNDAMSGLDPGDSADFWKLYFDFSGNTTTAASQRQVVVLYWI